MNFPVDREKFFDYQVDIRMVLPFMNGNRPLYVEFFDKQTNDDIMRAKLPRARGVTIGGKRLQEYIKPQDLVNLAARVPSLKKITVRFFCEGSRDLILGGNLLRKRPVGVGPGHSPRSIPTCNGESS